MSRPTTQQYWSSCCGEPAEYMGHYQCTGCGKHLNLGGSPCITGNASEAQRIRRERAEALVPDGCLF